MTYQVVYWVWVKLETDEIKDKKRSGRSQPPRRIHFANTLFEEEIVDLESQVQKIRDKPSP